jgi:peptidoglycan-N-acetylglucosamine deacetylase
MITTVATIASAAIAASASAYFAPQLVRNAQCRVLLGRTRATRSLVLTYDDGPGASLTPKLLDLLSAANAKATFFALGANALANPSVLDRMVADGHELGSHTQTHLNAWKVAPWRAMRDVRDGFVSLTRWLPQGQGPFRPPFGKLTLPAWLAARRAGSIRTCWWTIDSGDTHSTLPTVESIVGRVARAGGGVILMHDFERRHAERAGFVITLTDRLIALCRREALVVRRLVDVFDLAQDHRSPRQPIVTHHAHV